MGERLNVCMHACEDGWRGVGGGRCEVGVDMHFLRDVPSMVFWRWLGVWQVIRVAADQWQMERAHRGPVSQLPNECDLE